MTALITILAWPVFLLGPVLPVFEFLGWRIANRVFMAWAVCLGLLMALCAASIYIDTRAWCATRPGCVWSK